MITLLQHSHRLLRGTAAVTILCFTGMITTPTVQALEQRGDPASRARALGGQTAPVETPATRMSRLVDRLRQRLAVLGGEPRLAETARAKAASALERAATTPAGIGDLLEGLDNADRQMQAQFRATAALIERKHLPPEIAARHRAFIADYQERLRQLRAALAPLATPIAADGASGPGSIDRQQARQALDQLDRLAPTTPPKPDLDRLRRRTNPKQPGNRPRQHRG
ncbi:MAG TPA: hypothetical protein ENJ21_02315, partial [Chromatiaceae bacterium]|nr:hypothetical protein [Chromatiaceae bacterium]